MHIQIVEMDYAILEWSFLEYVVLGDIQPCEIDFFTKGADISVGKILLILLHPATNIITWVYQDVDISTRLYMSNPISFLFLPIMVILLYCFFKAPSLF
jgi:hypothetical protein